MRRADLRVYDIRLLTGMLGIFCALSVAFFLFLYGNYIIPKDIPITVYLWSSYGIIAVTAGSIYAATRKPVYEWVRVVGASELIGKGKYHLEKGTSYLIADDAKAQDIILDSLTYKIPCLYITRNNPDILRQKEPQFNDANILWLSELGEKNTANPANLEELSYTIRQYLDKASASVILFDGLPYLLNALPFQRVFYFLQDIRDLVAMRQGVLLISLDPGLVDKTRRALLDRELSWL